MAQEIQPLGVKDLVKRVHERGRLSERSSLALQKGITVGRIEESLGQSHTVTNGVQTLLVTLMPDDSQSMTLGPKQEGVIKGHNDLIRALGQAAGSDRILLQTRYLNGTTLNPFQPLRLCRGLGRNNYPCTHATPLFSQTIATLGAVVVKVEELLDDGVPNVRTATLLMTDAESTESNREEMRLEVRSVVQDLQRQGEHIIAGMGFTSGAHQSFREVFQGMGIDPEHIFDARDLDEILEKFGVFTKKTLELSSRPALPRVFEG